jgi:translocation and assembly module TamB
LVVAGADLRLAGLDLRLGRAALQGDLALGADQVEGEMQLSRLPLALLGRFGAPELNGEAGATLRLSGAVGNPRVEVGLELADLGLADPDFAELPPLRLIADARLADRRLEGSARAEGVSDRPLTASFDLPLVLRLQPVVVELPQDGAIGGRLDGELQLARLSDLVLDDQSLEGLLAAAFTIGGTLGAPQVDGSLRLTDGGYANGTTGTVLRDLTLVADASNERITIRELSATDGGEGRVEGQGEIGFGDGVEMDVRAQARQARLVRRDDADAAVSGDVRLQGTASAARLAGEVTVERAEIRIPNRVGPSVPVIEVQRIGADGEAEAPPEASADPFLLRLDVDVQIPGQLFVRGRGLQSEWEGALEVTGTASEPSVVGELRVRRGHFDFIDRRFQLAESTIEFTGATPPDPTLGIQATAEASDMTAIVRVTGPASKPEFAFDSQPPLPRDEVLSRLLFNRPISEIGPLQAAQLAFAVNRLRGGGGLDVLGELRRGLGVDTLDVVTGDSPQDGASVRAGRYLSDDVYLELEQGMGEQTSRARIEVEILPNVSVEADTGADARSGIGLRWRFDY